MEEDQGFRSSSSVLIALSSLTPPSPVLSPTQLPTTLTSGEIPIFLDYVDQVAGSSFHEHEHRAGCSDFDVDVPLSSTIGTLSTRLHRNSWILEPWSSTPGKRDTFGGATDPASGLATGTHPLAGAPEPECLMTDDHSQFTVSAYLSSSSSHSIGKFEVLSASTLDDDRKGGHATYLEDEGPSLDHPVLVHKPIISHTSPSPSSSHSYLLSNPLPLRPRLTVKSSSSCPSSPRSLENQSKVADNENGGDALGASHIRHATVESLPEFLRSSQGSRIYHISTSARGFRFKQSLPMSLAWLDATSFIELLIDQEGFRAVQARFKFTGYSNRRSWHPYGNDLDNMAQFRPISRQMFNFHYATLEALPVLRRVAVNGDEARDYITRQASLGLKYNGVYTVRGNEVPSLPGTFGNGDTPVKLRWKFEYFVDDRRFDAIGKKIVDGEKILTPLTFSCSPLLLHPFQGKRITMMHIVKKSVATRLVAEKMEPPSPSPAPKPISAHPLAKSSVWNMHRRTKSHVPSPTKDFDRQRKPGIVPVSQDVDARRMEGSYGGQIRRRRVSSAGEWGRPRPDVASPNPNDAQWRGSSPGYATRHIIPRSHLAHLLDLETENMPLATVSPPPMDTSGFQPLKPSPRHRQARVLRS